MQAAVDESHDTEIQAASSILGRWLFIVDYKYLNNQRRRLTSRVLVYTMSDRCSASLITAFGSPKSSYPIEDETLYYLHHRITVGRFIGGELRVG